ncbi:Peptidase family C54 [Popillia japonica]|uniref:Cysteine protease n=1 Tax=Popillia japonica TaxID=7064 RepID=A0AAW1MAW6_POPJA
MSCLSAGFCQRKKWRFRNIFRYMCIATREIMDCMYEVYYSHEGGVEPDDIPKTKEPVWILGHKYNATKDIDKIRRDITSKIWCTYRKGFVPIGGGEGLTSDRGWGCMLRCGQMVLAQALICLHLGREWCWDIDTKDPIYLKILHKFEDKRQAPFSIHQIALMGASEGKNVGEWFGPNTVAQVLKKLAKYDEWSSLAIHVALDNLVIISEIRDLCLPKQGNPHLLNLWTPLLLIVPLRLGLTEINPIYLNGIQNCFKLKQSLGVIGGKPNLALYFIGCVDNEVIYLDPHTTQRVGSMENKETEDQIELDQTYHCKRAARMNILAMDPSIAVCFLCKTEAEFIDLCQKIRDEIVTTEKQPLFEICTDKPKEWSPGIDLTAQDALGACASKNVLDQPTYYDSDEFEIV